MKRLIIITICSLVIVSCKNESKTVDKTVQKDEIVAKTKPIKNLELIDEFFTNEYLDSLGKTANFETVEKIFVFEGSDTLRICLQHIIDWNDPGDFLRVKIYDTKGKVIFNQTNFGGWVKFGNNYSLPEIVKEKNLIESNKALLIDNKTGKQLILFGWVYASQPGLMTIIDLFPTPEIIFNKKFELKEISMPTENGFKNMIGGTTVANTVTLNMEKMIIE